MTKVDVISGFLGAGKTTLIKKLLQETLRGEKVVLIENEFGEIGIDGGFLQDAGIEISEMNSGCICCSLVGDFGRALHQVMEQFHPDRILIEPSGVGKLSDVLRAVAGVAADEGEMEIGSAITVADGTKCRVYMKNFGEFYNDQVAAAATIVLSRTQSMSGDKLAQAAALLREKNPDAVVITTPWDQLRGDQILSAMDSRGAMERQLLEEARAARDHEHDHEHDHHDHDHGHEHDHHHDHGPDCACGCCGHDHDSHHEHDHDHQHHHHHADEVFISWGTETPRRFTEARLRAALETLDSGACGTVLRAKGIVAAEEGAWFHFDYVPGEWELRRGSAEVTGRLCVIGAQLREDAIRMAFGL